MIEKIRGWGRRLVSLFLGCISVALLGGGTWLILLEGSPYFAFAGIACLVTAIGLRTRSRFGALVFALFLIGTILWSLADAGLAPWPLLSRLAGPAVLGFFVALAATGRGERLSVGGSVFACLLIIGIAFVLPHPESLLGREGVQSASADLPSADWTHYGNDQGGMRYSPLTEITPRNVSKLKVAWTYHAGGGLPGTYNSLQATPLAADGLLTFCTGYNDIVALDASTGRERWRHRSKIDIKGVLVTTCRGVARYVTPGEKSGHCAKRIIAGTVDARLIALDALDGKPCAEFGKNGVVDLRVGFGRMFKGYYYLTSAPAIARDKIVIGGWISDNQYVGEPSGVIRAFDTRTGKLVWAWDMGSPERTGAPAQGDRYTPGTPNSWAPISADDALGMVYLPIGNATPDYYGMHRTPIDDRYSSSVVALDIESGRLRWVFQTTHHDIWDYDVASQPTLFTLRTPSGDVPALVQATKRGEIFLLDRRTGKPLASVEERRVPTDGAPGERPSPTQPFSVGVPNVAGPALTEASMWGLTPLDQLWCRISFRRARYAGPLTPIGITDTIVYPGYIGGVNWGGVTIDPVRQMLFVNSNRMAMRDRLISRAEARARGLRRSTDRHITEPRGAVPMEGTPYGANISPFLSPLGVPCQQPPYGMITAIDLRTRKLAWTRPFGTAAGAGPLGLKLGLPLPLGAPNTGGSIVTASGLIFTGASQDERFRAIDAQSGRELWQILLPAGGHATPMTFKMPGGRQYVIIAAGGSKGLNTRISDQIVAFALP